jgi:hypothetical protein
MVALVAVGIALSVHGWSTAVATPRRLPPAIELAAWLLALLGMGALIWAQVAGIRRLVLARSRAWRWKLLVHVSVHVALLLGVPFAMLASDPWFFTTRVDSLVAPSGDRYYLDSGLLCSYEVRVRESGSFYLQRFDRVSPHPCVRGVRLATDGESGSVIVVGPDGQRVVTGSWNGPYLGPR